MRQAIPLHFTNIRRIDGKTAEIYAVDGRLTATRPDGEVESIDGRGQWLAPGMMSFSWLSIWQPLHTPSEKVLSRAKNAEKASRNALRSRMEVAQPRPAPSTSP